MSWAGAERLRPKLRMIPGSQIGAVSFPQRFGSSLNPHFHFHVLAIDGVLGEESTGRAIVPCRSDA